MGPPPIELLRRNPTKALEYWDETGNGFWKAKNNYLLTLIRILARVCSHPSS